MSLYKLVLIGVGGVGKSCLTIQFISQRFVEDYDPTLEDSYREAGQEDFSAVRDQYMRTGDGFLCVYSITYAASFAEVEALHAHTLRVKDVDKIPFVLAGNKCDLEESREVPAEKGQQLAAKLGCKFMETSAKTRVNVTEIFNTLVLEIKAYRLKHANSNTAAKPGEKEKSDRRRCTLV